MKKIIVLFCLLAAVLVLTACQAESLEIQAEFIEMPQYVNIPPGEISRDSTLLLMDKYISADNTYSIFLENDWELGELEAEGWIYIYTDQGAKVVMRYAKSESPDLSLEIVQDILEKKLLYKFDYIKKYHTDQPYLRNLSNVYAYSYRKFEDDGSMGYAVYGESEEAYYCFFMDLKQENNQAWRSFVISCDTFKELSAKDKQPDTIRWFNASCAILEAFDYNIYDGFDIEGMSEEEKEKVRERLSAQYGIADPVSADTYLEQIMSEGSHADFAGNVAVLYERFADVPEEEKADAMGNYYLTQVFVEFYQKMFAYYEEIGPDAIDGWDYSEAMLLLRMSYAAGYYTKEEALERSLNIANEMQERFSSWDEYMESVLRGYEYHTYEKTDKYRQSYERVRYQDNSPYDIDWDLELERTWL